MTLHCTEWQKLYSRTVVQNKNQLKPRPSDIEYFKYSILSNRVFNTVFNTFFKNENIDIGYSILFRAGIDIEYSLL